LVCGDLSPQNKEFFLIEPTGRLRPKRRQVAALHISTFLKMGLKSGLNPTRKNMKRRLTATTIFLFIIAFTSGLFAQDRSPLEKLGAFAGKWESKGKSLDTPYSKAGTSSAETNCSWSANHGYLVCDQTVHTSDETSNDLSIYTYNAADKSFSFFGLSRNDSHVRTPKLAIEGSLWTYSGGFDNKEGKHISFRTVNEFKSRDLVTYVSEYSEDGQHWVQTGSGSSTRVK